MKIVWTPGSVYEPRGTWDFQCYTYATTDNPYLPDFIIVGVETVVPENPSPWQLHREETRGYMSAIIRKNVPIGELHVARALGFTTVHNMIVEDEWQSIGVINRENLDTVKSAMEAAKLRSERESVGPTRLRDDHLLRD